MEFKKQIRLVWFRNDLRTIDHPALSRAIQECGQAQIPLAGIVAWETLQDQRFEFSAIDMLSFRRSGAFRRQFWVESVADLSRNLADMNIPLYAFGEGIISGIERLSAQFQVTKIYAIQHPGTEELALENDLKNGYAHHHVIEVEMFPLQTMTDVERLPFGDVKKIPQLFTAFRKQIEATLRVPAPLPKPPALPRTLQTPVLEAVHLYANSYIPDGAVQSPLPVRGGENAAQERLQAYFYEHQRLRIYKETRNGMLEWNDSSKLSFWLANGSISARQVYSEVKRYEAAHGANESTYWLIFELLWRDFFQYQLLRWGADMFRREGMAGLDIPFRNEPQRIRTWMEGKTGFPLVDAAMRELRATGYMSNRARQNAACFLVKYLDVDWRVGAAWFESNLIDYDAGSNYGNWQYIAGVGNDARGFRVFNIAKQTKEYDPKGLYLQRWLSPEEISDPKPIINEMNELQLQEATYRRAERRAKR